MGNPYNPHHAVVDPQDWGTRLLYMALLPFMLATIAMFAVIALLSLGLLLPAVLIYWGLTVEFAETAFNITVPKSVAMPGSGVLYSIERDHQLRVVSFTSHRYGGTPIVHFRFVGKQTRTCRENAPELLKAWEAYMWAMDCPRVNRELPPHFECKCGKEFA